MNTYYRFVVILFSAFHTVCVNVVFIDLVAYFFRIFSRKKTHNVVVCSFEFLREKNLCLDILLRVSSFLPWKLGPFSRKCTSKKMVLTFGNDLFSFSLRCLWVRLSRADAMLEI